MKYMKFFLPFIILFLSIGYAATNVTLTITGDLLVQSDIEDFDVYISDIKINDQQDITLLKSTLEFEYTFEKDFIFSTYFIDYDLTNASKSFDAIVKTTCTVSDELLNILINTFESETIIEATTTTTGSIAIESYGPEQKSISCSISATPIERNSYGEGEVPPELEPIVPVHLKSTYQGDLSDFRSYEYSDYINTITFEDKINIPSDAIASWDISAEQNGKIMSYISCLYVNTYYFSDCTLYIQSNDKMYANPDMSWWFSSFTSLKAINNLNLLDTSKVTNMSNMFNYTGYASQSLNLDLSSFDTSNVTDMSYMFYSTAAYSGGFSNTSFTLDVSSFNTSNVTNMSNMFNNTGSTRSNFTLDISNFDTSKVTDMSSMFKSTGSDNTEFTLKLGENFDTSNVTDMNSMFANTGSNSTKLNTSITIRNPSVTNYTSMFYGVATKGNSQITVNYTSKTSMLVDKMIATKTSEANVVKGQLVQIITDDIDIGDEIAIGDEHFNVISDNGDGTITMLAKYNLGTDYKQSSGDYFSINLNSSSPSWVVNGIDVDINSLSNEFKNYLNSYVTYLQSETSDYTLTASLLTTTKLSALGCTIESSYIRIAEPISNNTCINSPYISWLVNGQASWTLTIYVYDYLFRIQENGELYHGGFNSIVGIRPIITISKNALQ